jgi:serine/threonine protein kinase
MAADAERLARFRREAQAVAALNHPNVVTVYAVEDAGDTVFLTMELVEGQTLAALMRPGGLPLREWVTLAMPLVDAVGAAHVQGVVHRDLKPSNVMIGPGGRLKVLDFGLAKLQPRATRSDEATVTAHVTDKQQILGTPAYMSPEQAEGRQVDQRTDIFSLGVLLYELASGARPFTGDSSMAIISSILKDTPTPLAVARPDLPADVDRIVRRCLAKDPTRRYQSAVDLRNDLEDVQALLSMPSGAVTVARPARPRWVIAAGAAAILAMALLGYSAWSSRRTTAADPSPPRASFTQLTSQSAAELFSSLSPDGKWLVYGGEGDGHRDVFLQSTTGQTPINLTKDSPADDDQPAF